MMMMKKEYNTILNLIKQDHRCIFVKDKPN